MIEEDESPHKIALLDKDGAFDKRDYIAARDRQGFWGK